LVQARHWGARNPASTYSSAGFEIHDISKTLVMARRPKGAEAIQKGGRTQARWIASLRSQ
ncbi:MAG: hypothetical protein ACLQME_20270, partial [Alphaproteobacteria bacterium]